jgi:NAD(P)-dependent dehydrogenase (short-subunit alcohol dehydrogenase family)
MTQLNGVHAVVTGASSGLGLAMAEALAEAGATVALASRPSDTLIQVVTRLKERGLDVVDLPMDVRSETSIGEAVAWVKTNWKSLDVLVNNAGIGMKTVNPKFLTEPQPFYKVTPEGFRDLIETNLTGYFLVSRAFAPLFLAQKKGKIVNISMNHETMKRKGFIPYGPSRAGAESLTYIMAEDLREAGITVNMLLPGGATETEMIPEAVREEVLKQVSLLKPSVMAEPIVYLASDKSDGLTGQRFVATDFEKWGEN